MNVMLHLVTMTVLIILNTSIFREVKARTRRLESATNNPRWRCGLDEYKTKIYYLNVKTLQISLYYDIDLECFSGK